MEISHFLASSLNIFSNLYASLWKQVKVITISPAVPLLLVLLLPENLLTQISDTTFFPFSLSQVLMVRPKSSLFLTRRGHLKNIFFLLLLFSFSYYHLGYIYLSSSILA